MCSGCLQDRPVAAQEEDGGQQQEQPDVQGGEPSAPVEMTLTGHSVVNTSVREISGMCFNKDASGFFVVSDENGLYEIDLGGKILKEIWTSSDWGKEDHDFEAVALDAAGGRLFLLDETESRIYVLTGANWGTRNVFMDIDLGTTDPGNGPEGMCWGDGKLYVTNQGSPTRLAAVDVATKTIVSHADLTFMKKYLSDASYDSKDGTLWIIDSKADAFFHCKPDGTLLGTYRLGFSVAQAEAIAVDRKNSCIWLGSDEKPTSPLYKIPFTF